MEYINTDSETYDIKHGRLTENPLRGSTARYICNPIVDDIEAPSDPKGRARRRRINGRIVIDTTVLDGAGEQYRPPNCLVVGEPSVNNLATHRWRNDGLPDAKTEAELIRRVRGGSGTRQAKPNPGREDERAFRKLLEAFHRTVVGPAGKHIPRETFSKHRPKGVKHTNDLLYEDLTSVGCESLWQSALKFDPDGGHRFNTLSRHKIVGAIKNEANYLRQRGFTNVDTVGRYSHKKVSERSQTRLDRWIFDHPGSPPEELLEAQKKLVKRPVFHSLEEAAAAIKAANDLKYCDVYSGGGDGDDIERGCESDGYTDATRTLEEFHDVYDSRNHLKWSPQLRTHLKVSAIVNFWTKELCDPPRIKAKPQPKPVYRPCAVKPTGRVLHPIDKPSWMEPRDERPNERPGKPYDPDRREVAVIRLKRGKTKRVYRQMSANPGRHIQMNEAKGKQNDVRPNRKQAIGSPTAEIVVFQSRASGVEGLHLGERCYSPCIGQRFTGARIAGQ